MFKKDKKLDERCGQVIIQPVCNCCVAASDSHELIACKINEEATITVGALACQGKELKVRVEFEDVCRNYKLAVSVFIGFRQDTDVVLNPMNVYAYKVCIVDELMNLKKDVYH